MTTAVTPPRRTRADLAVAHSQDGTLVDLVVLIIVLVVAGLHLPLIFRINIGWDEFRFLSDVYAYQRGDVANALQTIHVHLFSWLPRLGGTEVDQVIAARGVYYLLLLGSCGFIYLIARTYLTRAAALFAVLVFLAYSDVLGYATTFRFDGLSLFLLLGSLALVVRRPAAPWALGAAAGLTALAAMVTIKSLFYLPTLLLVTMIAGGDEAWRKKLFRGLGFTGAVSLLVACLYFLHNASLPKATVAESVGLLQRAGPTGIKLFDPFPQVAYLIRTVFVNIWTWIFLGLGLGILIQRCVKRDGARQALLLLALLVPIGSLVIYRNAFPYFYVLLIPVAAIVAGVPFDNLIRRRERRAYLAAGSMGLIMLLGFAAHYGDHWRDETQAQRQLVEVVHRMFPEPVPYIDPSSIIASFPKVGFFMSNWGFEQYHRGGQPIFEDLLAEHRPVFLIAENPLLLDDSGIDSVPDRLHPADVEVLRRNYIHHWRSIYVAGQRAPVSDTDPTWLRFTIPGPYTVEAQAPILVGEHVYRPGDEVLLEPGWIQLKALTGSVEVTLRWGSDLYRPSDDPVPAPIFRGFYPCGSFFSGCPALPS